MRARAAATMGAEDPHRPLAAARGVSAPDSFAPAKWAAKLRASKTDENLLLLKMTMEAGHGGVSGRYDWYRELAFQYAFLLDRLGIGE